MLIKKPIIYCVREHIVCILSHFLKSRSRFWFTFTCRNLNAAFACMRSTFFFGMQLSSFMHCDSFSNSGPLPLVLLWGCVCLLVSAEHNVYCCLVFYFYFLTECYLVMYQLLNISHSSKVAGATVDWIAYSQMNGSNSSGSCESIAYPLSWERCCGSSPRDSPIHSMGFLSRILLQGKLLAKQKEIIIQLELGDRLLENKRLVYI